MVEAEIPEDYKPENIDEEGFQDTPIIEEEF